MGDRFYLKGKVKLTADLVATLKNWNSSYPRLTAEFDGQFLSHLLDAVFGRKVLAASSVSGKKSNNNGAAHVGLDGELLQFVKSACSRKKSNLQFLFTIFIFAFLCFQPFSRRELVAIIVDSSASITWSAENAAI